MNAHYLSQYLDNSASRAPDQIALIDEQTSLSFAALRDDARRMAAWLQQQGIERGDRVIVLMSNSCALAQCFWAVQLCGAVYVPLHPETKADKLAWIIDDCTASLLIADADYEGEALRARVMSASPPALVIAGSSQQGETELAQLLSCRERWRAPTLLALDLASIIYTSGSTGKPKGVMLTQRNMLAASQSVAHYLQLSAEDRIYCALPLSFDYGLQQLIMAARVGATVIIEKNFSQPLFALHRMVKQRATVFPLVPTMVSLIAPLSRRFDFSHIRTVTSTSAALHAPDIALLRDLFAAARLYSMYGLTECHRCTWLDPQQLDARTLSVGKAIPGTEMWVIDADGREQRKNATGELVIRGETVMRGYWNNPQKTAEKLRPGRFPGEVVLYTGDICRLDEEGFLYFISRTDDVLNSAGEKVAPREVENVLAAHPQITQVAVVGVPHAVYGDEIVAWIETDQPLALQPLRDWCRARLEHYMVPHRFMLARALPKNGNNKIDRLALKALSQQPEPQPLTAGEKHAEL